MTRPADWLIALRDDRKLSEHARMAYVMLRAREPDVRPSYPMLARDMGASRATAARAVAELVAAGWVKVEQRQDGRGGTVSNTYHCLTPPSLCETGGVSQGDGPSLCVRPKEVHQGKEVHQVKENLSRHRPRRGDPPMDGQQALLGALPPVAEGSNPSQQPTGTGPGTSQQGKTSTDGKSQAGEVVAAFCDARSPRTITGRERGQIGRDAKQLLAAGVDPGELIAAAAELGAGVHSNLRTQVQIRERDRERAKAHPDGYEWVNPTECEWVNPANADEYVPGTGTW